MAALDFLGALFGNNRGANPTLDPTNMGLPLPTKGGAIFEGDVPDYAKETPDPMSILTQGQPQSQDSGVQDYIGQVIDAYLQIHGRPAVYAPVMQQKALEGFTTDPIAAIQRLAKTPGGAKMAIPLYISMMKGGKNAAKEAAQTAASQSTADKNNYLLFSNFAKTSNPKNWTRNRQILEGFAKKRGLDVGDIPEQFDPDWVESVGGFGITPYQEKRLGNFGEQIDINRGKAGEDVRHHKVTEEISGGNLSEKTRHNKTTEDVADYNARTNRSRAKTYNADVFRKTLKDDPIPKSKAPAGTRKVNPVTETVWVAQPDGTWKREGE